MAAKKPTELTIKRAKPKLKVVRREVLKNEPWYAAVASQMGIKTPDRRDKSRTPEKGQEP
jgi:hypothetical protein